MNKKDILIILGGIVLLRAIVTIIAFIWFDFAANPHEDILSIWHRWDAHHYGRIAEHGYSAQGLNTADHRFLSRFPPLYPLLCRFISTITGLPFRFVGPMVSLLSVFLASLLLFKLALFESGNRTCAYQSVVFLNCFPTAYFSQTALTDGLFLLILTGLFYSIRVQEWHSLSWLLSGLGILTRTVGITFIIPSLVIVARNLRSGTLKVNHLWGAFFPAFAILVVFLCNYVFYGDPMMFFQDYQTTNHSIRSAPYPFSDLFQQILTIIRGSPGVFFDQSFMFHQGWGALLSIFCIATLILGRSFIAIEYQVFSWGYFLFLHSTSWAISMPRYLWMIFPIFLILAQIKRVLVFALITICSLALQIYFALRFTSGVWGF